MSDHSRFSDAKLMELDNKICSLHKHFNTFEENFKEHEEAEQANQIKVYESSEEAKELSQEMVHRLETIIVRLDKVDSRIDGIEQRVGVITKNTADAVKLTKNVKATFDLFDSLQQGGLWLAKWGIIFGAFIATYAYIQRIEVKPEVKKPAVIIPQNQQKEKDKKIGLAP